MRSSSLCWCHILPPISLSTSLQVGHDYFRVHPKGVGLVCSRRGGLPPLTLVEEYLGELHPPWRWAEIQVRATCRDKDR